MLSFYTTYANSFFFASFLLSFLMFVCSYEGKIESVKLKSLKPIIDISNYLIRFTKTSNARILLILDLLMRTMLLYIKVLHAKVLRMVSLHPVAVISMWMPLSN